MSIVSETFGWNGEGNVGGWRDLEQSVRFLHPAGRRRLEEGFPGVLRYEGESAR